MWRVQSSGSDKVWRRDADGYDKVWRRCAVITVIVAAVVVYAVDVIVVATRWQQRVTCDE